MSQPRVLRTFVLGLTGLALAATLAPATAATGPTAPTGGSAGAAAGAPSGAERHVRYEGFDTARDFAAGAASGTSTGQVVRLDGPRRVTTYDDPFGDGGTRTYDVGRWTSPVVRLGFGADEAIASWNATTPRGTWVETRLRGRHADGTWTRWYVMGRWTSGMAPGDIHRTSVDDQGDADGTVYTDTFAAADGRAVRAVQVRARLLRPTGTRRTPSLSALGVMASRVPDAAPPTSTYTRGRRIELAVPRFSQNIHRGEYPAYGGGGQVWCSPTSTSMVQYFWGEEHEVPAADLAGIDAPNGDPQVAYAAKHTWDFAYDGAGNWPFNAAYAADHGLETFVTRLRSLREVERFVAAGIPVVVSLSWDEEEMPEAGYGTNGHLMVVVGFTAEGDPILNDPASSSNEAVRNVYTRENFERVWQGSTGGISYVYRAPGTPLPARTPEHNW